MEYHKSQLRVTQNQTVKRHLDDVFLNFQTMMQVKKVTLKMP
jgi:hypothetical protein